jgi:glycosyltransferase involved in cell wall biosynthesis
VLSEAMAVGTPVSPRAWAASPRSSTDGVTGVLVEPGEPAALAAAVLDVLGRRDSDERAPPRARAAQRFGADAYADRVEALSAR